MTSDRDAPPAGRIAPWEWLGLAAIAALAGYFVATSWLRWPEPLIDFGRELYLPWRLANGAVMYRDADDLYGPLSQYANAALFRLFGPGLLVLVAANLLVFAAALAAVYLLIRRAWGARAAAASASVFAAVFGFSQLTRGNYNFATPYAHEATHGFLVCLALAAVLMRWVERPTPLLAFAAGGLLGLAAVLKLEILLAAGLVTAAAVAVRVVQRRPPAWRHLAPWAAGAALPTALFWAYFARHLPAGYSLALACHAWLNVFGSRAFVTDVLQTTFLGVDKPWAHLVEHARCTAAALALLGALAGAARLAGRTARAPARAALAVPVLGATAWLGWSAVDWMEIGRCLLGLTLAYVCFEGALVWRRAGTPAAAPAEVRRVLLAVLAAGLMARMPLYGRIYQYGFYQAALAALVVSAVLVGEVPQRLGAGRAARVLAAAAYAVLLATGALRLAAHSQAYLRAKTFQVGSGIDRFYAFPTAMEPTAELVRLVSEELRGAPPGSTLLVLPEGEMINYLARLPSPVAPFFFFSEATKGGREEEIVRKLDEHHPDYVVVISRDLREYGVARYGESYGQGRRILEWVAAHYQATSIYGGSPVDTSQRGAVILGWRG